MPAVLLQTSPSSCNCSLKFCRDNANACSAPSEHNIGLKLPGIKIPGFINVAPLEHKNTTGIGKRICSK